MGYIIALISLLPLKGSLIGLRITSISRPPSSFKMQFHEPGPRFEIGFDFLRSQEEETAALFDTSDWDTSVTQQTSKYRSNSIGVSMGVLFPFGKIKLADETRLIGLVGAGPGYTRTYTFSQQKSPQDSTENTTENTKNTVKFAITTGVELAFRLFGYNLRVQFLTTPLSFNYRKSKGKSTSITSYHRSYSESESSKFWVEGLNLTTGLITTWLMIYMP